MSMCLTNWWWHRRCFSLCHICCQSSMVRSWNTLSQSDIDLAWPREFCELPLKMLQLHWLNVVMATRNTKSNNGFQWISLANLTHDERKHLHKDETLAWFQGFASSKCWRQQKASSFDSLVSFIVDSVQIQSSGHVSRTREQKLLSMWCCSVVTSKANCPYIPTQRAQWSIIGSLLFKHFHYVKLVPLVVCFVVRSGRHRRAHPVHLFSHSTSSGSSIKTNRPVSKCPINLKLKWRLGKHLVFVVHWVHGQFIAFACSYWTRVSVVIRQWWCSIRTESGMHQPHKLEPINCDQACWHCENGMALSEAITILQ